MAKIKHSVMEGRVSRTLEFFHRGELDLTPDDIAGRLDISVHLARQVRRQAEYQYYVINSPVAPDVNKLCIAYERLRQWCGDNGCSFRETVCHLIDQHLANPHPLTGGQV